MHCCFSTFDLSSGALQSWNIRNFQEYHHHQFAALKKDYRVIPSRRSELSLAVSKSMMMFPRAGEKTSGILLSCDQHLMLRFPL
jgi:hypothetical protein